MDVAGVSRDVLPVCVPPSGTSSRSQDKVLNCGLFLYRLPPPGQADLDLIRLNLLPWACLEKKPEKTQQPSIWQLNFKEKHVCSEMLLLRAGAEKGETFIRCTELWQFSFVNEAERKVSLSKCGPFR